MERHEAIRKFFRYLKLHNIRHFKQMDEGVLRCRIEFNKELAPDRTIEACIWFFESTMEVRVYYNEVAARWVKEGDHFNELAQVLNFCNARVFLSSCDGAGNTLYQPSLLYTPRFYITADGHCDICMTTTIPYDFYELTPLETEDYITIFCPHVLERLTYSLIGTAVGKLTPKEAIMQINSDLLEESDPTPEWTY